MLFPGSRDQFQRQRRASIKCQALHGAFQRYLLPCADESFDCAVVTLVFCSVNDPVRGMSEIRRVLKSGASLLMIEHVRARGAMIAAIQSLVTPLTRLMIGNCHWNRDTERTVREAGFSIEQRRELLWFKMPFLVLRAVK